MHLLNLLAQGRLIDKYEEKKIASRVKIMQNYRQDMNWTEETEPRFQSLFFEFL